MDSNTSQGHMRKRSSEIALRRISDNTFEAPHKTGSGGITQSKKPFMPEIYEITRFLIIGDGVPLHPEAGFY